MSKSLKVTFLGFGNCSQGILVIRGRVAHAVDSKSVLWDNKFEEKSQDMEAM